MLSSPTACWNELTWLYDRMLMAANTSLQYDCIDCGDAIPNVRVLLLNNCEDLKKNRQGEFVNVNVNVNVYNVRRFAW